MFLLSEVVEVCLCCGHVVGKPFEAFETFVADVLQAKVADVGHVGYDVYGSKLFPSLTFQVKMANAHLIFSGRRPLPQWTWSEHASACADIYVLFGIKDEKVYPFVMAGQEWLSGGCLSGAGIRFVMTAEPRFRGGRLHKYWQYYIEDWPQGLLDKVQDYVGDQGPVVCRSATVEQMCLGIA